MLGKLHVNFKKKNSYCFTSLKLTLIKTNIWLSENNRKLKKILSFHCNIYINLICKFFVYFSWEQTTVVKNLRSMRILSMFCFIIRAANTYKNRRTFISRNIDNRLINLNRLRSQTNLISCKFVWIKMRFRRMKIKGKMFVQIIYYKLANGNSCDFDYPRINISN